MLLAIICQLSVLVAANPFHNYPRVFLLDVGNEELEKTNTEQIRLSLPGGSVALRYPAIGYGDTIGHIRVSSIDFGTDLKVNIIDGGPGYKYAVLVFMSNPGVPYDAVVTVQTLSDETFNAPNIGFVPNSVSASGQLEDDNNSAEDLSDDPPKSQSETYVQSSNAELMQSSSNVYNYAENEVMDQNDDSDEGNNSDSSQESSDELDDEEPDIGEKHINDEYTDDIDQNYNRDVKVKSIDEDDEDDDEEISPELAQYVPNDYSEDDKPTSFVENSLNTDYVGRTPYIVTGETNYEYQNNVRPEYKQDYEDPDETEQVFNDGEVHNSGDKYRDTNNNNYIDSDDSFAVPY